ncbi:MAG: hypothetical protein WBO24_21520 [Nitrospirales bacterium]
MSRTIYPLALCPIPVCEQLNKSDTIVLICVDVEDSLGVPPFCFRKMNVPLTSTFHHTEAMGVEVVEAQPEGLICYFLLSLNNIHRAAVCGGGFS